MIDIVGLLLGQCSGMKVKFLFFNFTKEVYHE